MEQLKGNGYLFLVAVLVILILLGAFYGRNLLDYVKKNDYIIYAGLLALLSFIVINWGNKKAAERSQEKITKATNEIVEKAVGQATMEIQNEVKVITEKSTGEAVKQITDNVGKIKNELDEQLQSLKQATKQLKFLQANPDILVQIEYQFQYENESYDIDFYNNMVEQLTIGNTYELTLESGDKKSEFLSEKNSFRTFNEEIDDSQEKIENTYVGAILSNEHYRNTSPQMVKVNYLLDVSVLDFNFEDLKIGDKVEFRLRKRTSLNGENYLFEKRRANHDYFKGGFTSFVYGHDSWPRAVVGLKVMTRNGYIFSCKVIKTDRLSKTDIDYGYVTLQEIIEITKTEN
ncbi:MAG: hypothetical protein RIB79_11415 [Allomuricauda sp.]|jgi:hypothetical protein